MGTRRIIHSRKKKMVWTIGFAPRSKLGNPTAIASMQKAAARRPIDTFGSKGTKSELMGQKRITLKCVSPVSIVIEIKGLGAVGHRVKAQLHINKPHHGFQYQSRESPFLIIPHLQKN